MSGSISLRKQLFAFTASAAFIFTTTVANAASILIVNGANVTSETDTTAAITNNLANLETLAGNTTTTVNSFVAGTDLSGYSAVWDIRFSTSSPLTSDDKSAYLAYLQGGGSLFLMGENSGFASRNNSIFDLISILGGGSVGFSSCADGVPTETVNAPLTGPNPVTSFQYLAPGAFSGTGTGSLITQLSSSCGSAAAWAPGTLANADAGALVSVLDVNFMENVPTVSQDSQNFFENLIGFVNSGQQPTTPPSGVPEPLTLSLFGAGLAGLVGMRRRRK